MTINELIAHFNNTFELHNWPTTFEVDAITYVNAFNHILDMKSQNLEFQRLGNPRIGQYYVFEIMIGKHKGIFIRNIELICKEVK